MAESILLVLLWHCGPLIRLPWSPAQLHGYVLECPQFPRTAFVSQYSPYVECGNVGSRHVAHTASTWNLLEQLEAEMYAATAVSISHLSCLSCSMGCVMLCPCHCRWGVSCLCRCRDLVANSCRHLRLGAVCVWQLHQERRASLASLSAQQDTGSAHVDPASAGAVADAESRVQAEGRSQRWLPGPCDWHPDCSLCRQEQQQQQQQQHANTGAASRGVGSSIDDSRRSVGDCSNASNPYTSWAVPYDDPYMFRRLLWRLLGKLSPAAQTLYSQHAGMCPHCADSG